MSGEQNSKPIIVNEKTTSTSQCTITMNILFFRYLCHYNQITHIFTTINIVSTKGTTR